MTWFQLHIICLFVLVVEPITEPIPADTLECLMHTKRKGNNYHYSGTKSVAAYLNRTCRHWPSPLWSRGVLNYCQQFEKDDPYKPWCLLSEKTHYGENWSYCDIPMCAGNCLGPKVNDVFYFSGTHTVTKSGKKCQRWDASKPTKPNEITINLGMNMRKSMKNYCYTTDSYEFPWCYIDSEKRWEDCANADCYTLKMNCLGESINGNHYYIGTQNFTQSNKPCKRWDSLDAELLTSTNIANIYRGPIESLENYCRTIFSLENDPMCFTSTGPDAKWETCGIARCDADNCLGPVISGKIYYHGTQQVTRTNRTCQRWDSTFPHTPDTDVRDLGIYNLESMENFCRTPTDSHTVPWCYTMDDNTSWEECGIAFCNNGLIPTDNCLGSPIDGKYYYRGTQQVTKTGKRCQRWDSSYPHVPTAAILKFENYERKSMENFCRTPTSYSVPWCYTMDPNSTWEECGIKICHDGFVPNQNECLMRTTKVGHNYHYSGTQSVTVSNRTCQKWDRNEPHDLFNARQENVSMASRTFLSNFCRQFNEKPSEIYPWCYTTDCNVPWEYCNTIPKCEGDCLGPKANDNFYFSGTQTVTKSGKTCQRWDAYLPTVSNDSELSALHMETRKSMENYCYTSESYEFPWCYTVDNETQWDECDITECYTIEKNCLGPVFHGKYFYQGTQTVTKTNKTCIRWDSLASYVPHSAISNFDNDTLKSMANFCRTPLTYGIPWCYYTKGTSTTWEECGIPSCDGGPIPTNQQECLMRTKKKGHNYHYSGTMNITVSGRTCQAWAHNEPHKVFQAMQSNFSMDSRKNLSNFCRQFDNESSKTKPWCYTTNLNVTWEYCDIPLCAGDCLGPKVNAAFYFSGTQTVTKSGKKCQRWDASYPYLLNETKRMYKPNFKSMENRCHTSLNHEYPWCLTMDKNMHREDCENTECYTMENNCLGPFIDEHYFYQGTQNVTRTNKTCQRWDSLSLDLHEQYLIINTYDNDTLKSMENYCRSLLDYSVPWCYTTDPTSFWEECGIAKCDDESIPTNQQECLMRTKITGVNYHYSGTMSHTVSNRKCQHWAHNEPHDIYNKMIDKLGSSFYKRRRLLNYCRQFDGDNSTKTQPWCYTTDRNVIWEYCDIPKCAGDCVGPKANDNFHFSGIQNVTKSGLKCQRWDASASTKQRDSDLLELDMETRKEMENYCYTSKSYEYPWCYTLNNTVPWGDCDNAKCDNFTNNCIGPVFYGKYFYHGTQTVTKTNKTCLRWDSLASYVPHSAILNFDNDTLKSMANFCRTPLTHNIPWCYYTTGFSTTWEECGIPNCYDGTIPKNEQECLKRKEKKGNNYHYAGTMSHTVSGRTCQAWAHNKPHKVFQAMQSNFSMNRRTKLYNFCRQFDEESNKKKPWCYTTNDNVTWEYCDIPMCAGDCVGPLVNAFFYYSGTQTVTKSGHKCVRWDSPAVSNKYQGFVHKSLLKSMENYCHTVPHFFEKPWCFYTIGGELLREECENAQCYTKKKNCLGPLIQGTYFYQGTQNKTKTGKICQRWDSPFPHVPHKSILEMDIDTLKSMENFCRAPTLLYSVPWCYTTDPDIRREECGISKCDDKTIPTNAPLSDNCLGPLINGTYYYQGTYNFTKSGIVCQAWEHDFPHRKIEALGDMDPWRLESMKNWCRAPDTTSSVPWCYTTNEYTVREECGIPMCNDDNSVLLFQWKPKMQYSINEAFQTVKRGYGKYSWWYVDLVHLFAITKVNILTTLDKSIYLENMKIMCGKTLRYLKQCAFLPGPIKPNNHFNLSCQCIGRFIYLNRTGSFSFPLEHVLVLGSYIGPKANKIFYFSGSQTVTKSGKKCQRWDATYPHIPAEGILKLGHDTLKTMKNYCYSTYSYAEAWCYTMDKDMPWEQCNITHIDTIQKNCYRFVNGHYHYRGTQHIAQKGQTCLRWDPAKKALLKSLKLDLDNHTLTSMGNFCRSLDGIGQSPLCIIQHKPDTRLLTCNITQCDDGTQ